MKKTRSFDTNKLLLSRIRSRVFMWFFDMQQRPNLTSGAGANHDPNLPYLSFYRDSCNCATRCRPGVQKRYPMLAHFVAGYTIGSRPNYVQCIGILRRFNRRETSISGITCPQRLKGAEKSQKSQERPLTSFFDFSVPQARYIAIAGSDFPLVFSAAPFGQEFYGQKNSACMDWAPPCYIKVHISSTLRAKCTPANSMTSENMKCRRFRI